MSENLSQHVSPVTLEEVREQMRDCCLCRLCEGRNTIVFGDGNPHARVMFIGEGPGKNEDLGGRPFIGAAGKKLDGYLAAAGLSRDDIFITNVVKCRPPSNRNPRPEEIEACAPYLRNQVRAIWPDAIVCLGNFASQFILRTEKGVTSLRGRLYQTGHFVVLPTFHPAATIYHPAWEPLLTDDLRLLGQWLREHPKGQEIPADQGTSQGQGIPAKQVFSQEQEASHE